MPMCFDIIDGHQLLTIGLLTCYNCLNINTLGWVTFFAIFNLLVNDDFATAFHSFLLDLLL